MAKQVQFRRGTTSQTNAFTGAAGEVTVDTSKNTVVVHNGSTAGGFPLPKDLAGLGITATATEINALDGIPSTLTATELGYVDGVTSAIQTQINTKQAVVSGVSDAEIGYLDGVTSAIQTQINTKIADVVSDTSPQLGANLDTNQFDIVTISNRDLDLAPNGTGKVVFRGNTNSAAIVLNCENNSHGVTIQSPAHSAGSTYTTKLPDALGTTNASAIVTADANGVVTFTGGIVEDIVTITSSSNAATLNMRDGTNFVHDLTENVTYTFTNPASTGNVSAFTLKVIQGSTARTITWPSVKWAGGSAPTLTATNDAVDYFVFIYDGANWYGFTAGQALA